MATKSSKSKTGGSRRHNGKLSKKQEATFFALMAKKAEGDESSDE